MIFNSESEKETIEIARQFASKLASGDIVLLRGDLGMGKSVFARETVRNLCNSHMLEVPSPTFTLLQTYDGVDFPIWHFDLYRLEHPDEIYEIGWEEALSEGVLLVEWPERLGYLEPPEAINVKFSQGEDGPSSRIIEITGGKEE